MHGLRSANSRKIAGKTESLLRHTHSFHRVRERLIRVRTREGAKIARHRDEPDGLTWQGRLSCSDGWPVAGQPDVSRISRELHFCPRRFRPLTTLLGRSHLTRYVSASEGSRRPSWRNSQHLAPARCRARQVSASGDTLHIKASRDCRRRRARATRRPISLGGSIHIT